MAATDKSPTHGRRAEPIDGKGWPEMVTFVENVIELRRAKGLNQMDFAKLTGLSQPYVSSIETLRANPSYLVVAHIARVLGVPMTDLVHSKTIKLGFKGTAIPTKAPAAPAAKPKAKRAKPEDL